MKNFDFERNFKKGEIIALKERRLYDLHLKDIDGNSWIEDYFMVEKEEDLEDMKRISLEDIDRQGKSIYFYEFQIYEVKEDIFCETLEDFFERKEEEKVKEVNYITFLDEILKREVK